MNNLILIIGVMLMTFWGGKSAKNTQVFLESANGIELIAYQSTGEQGKVSFKHFNDGNYQLVVVFPQQEGKMLREKPKHQTLTKATFNPKNNTYYYQGNEGFFSVKMSGMAKIDKESIKPLFREVRGEEEDKIIIAQFYAKRNGAGFTLSIDAITAAQFKKATDKLGNDISMMSIPDMR